MLLNPEITSNMMVMRFSILMLINLLGWRKSIPSSPRSKSVVSAWRRPDTVIVNEPWWSPIAKWADIVFLRRLVLSDKIFVPRVTIIMRILWSALLNHIMNLRATMRYFLCCNKLVLGSVSLKIKVKSNG